MGRRLKTSDPAYKIFEAYAEEHAERWASAKALSMDEALKELPEVERKYRLECSEYSNVLFGLSEDLAPSAKLEQEKLAKLAEVGELQPQLDSAGIVAVDLKAGKGAARITDAAMLWQCVDDFEGQREKSVDTIMATKVNLDKKK